MYKYVQQSIGINRKIYIREKIIDITVIKNEYKKD